VRKLLHEWTLSQAELIERVGWLIKLRWLVFAGVLLTILVAQGAFRSSLPWGLLLATTFAIAVYNTVFYFVWHRGISNRPDRGSSALANAQISCDLLALGFLIHFSGGLENLFGFYFVFHVVIAGMLLSVRAAFAQTTLAALLFAGIVVGEYAGILPHYYSAIGVDFHGLYKDSIACFAAIWVMSTALYATAYFTTSVAATLRSREHQVVELYKRISESEKAKAAYTRKVAHELRSPLAAVESLLRVVADGLQGEIPEGVRAMISRARARTHELLALVQDLLALASARDARREGEWCDLDIGEVVDNVARLLCAQAERRNVTIGCEIASNLPKLRADREGMEQMLTNLISNAIKYSTEGGRVAIRVAELASEIVITVADTGIGIGEDDLAKVFDEFYRSRGAREHTPEGTGLGLAIVKTIVESHGGSVGVESAWGEGASFTVRIPLRPPAGPPPAD